MWDGHHLPDINLQFDFTEQIEDLKNINAGNIQEVIEKLQAGLMKNLKGDLNLRSIQFSFKGFRNQNPVTGEKKRGAKKRKTIRSLNMQITYQVWKPLKRLSR